MAREAPLPSRIPSVRAQGFVRKMKGGTQAHLLSCDDGEWYVVKFAGNPQGGRRILVNELLGSLLMNRLGLSTPEVALVEIDEAFLGANPEACMQIGPRGVRPEIGLHFGSRYRGRPNRSSVFDLLPAAVLPEVVNLYDLMGALVFDKWTSNGDARQAIFCRARVTGDEASRVGWFAELVDNGLCFQGHQWSFYDSGAQGVYWKPTVYGRNPSTLQFAPWVEALMRVTREELQRTAAFVPAEWTRGQERELATLMNRLYERRELVWDLLSESLRYIRDRRREKAARSRECVRSFKTEANALPCAV